jgi:integrase
VRAQAPKPVKRKSGQTRDAGRPSTRAERDAVVAHADELAAASGLNSRTQRKRAAVADLIGFLSGTGVRTAEARHLVWADVDLASGRVKINGTKSASAERTLDLPQWLTGRIRERALRVATTGYVFGWPHHTDGSNEIEWDQSNLARNIASVLASAGHGWASPHKLPPDSRQPRLRRGGAAGADRRPARPCRPVDDGVRVPGPRAARRPPLTWEPMIGNGMGIATEKDGPVFAGFPANTGPVVAGAGFEPATSGL